MREASFLFSHHTLLMPAISFNVSMNLVYADPSMTTETLTSMRRCFMGISRMIDFACMYSALSFSKRIPRYIRKELRIHISRFFIFTHIKDVTFTSHADV